MKGLIKNNFYTSLSSAKWLGVILAFLGAFVVIVDNSIPNLLIGYIFLSMVGFSINALASLRKQSSSKWEKYKLTAPIRRADILISYFLSQVIWLAVGIVFAAVCITLSILLHGFPFDRGTDVLMLFTTGISVSLLMCAAFFPLFYLTSEEKNEVVLIASLLIAIVFIMVLVSLINRFFGPNITFLQVLAGAGIIILSAILALTLSYPLTNLIFKRKDY